MLEDIRNHDPRPNPQELEWLATGVWAAVERALVLAGIALIIGTTASWLCDYQGESASFVVTSAPPAGR
jgi:hypothetical protein